VWAPGTRLSYRGEVAEQEQKEVARDILSAYRGIGSLNDVVIIVEGKADIETNDRVPTLLRELRAVADNSCVHRGDF
jgi:hypothetical protein